MWSGCFYSVVVAMGKMFPLHNKWVTSLRVEHFNPELNCNVRCRRPVRNSEEARDNVSSFHRNGSHSNGIGGPCPHNLSSHTFCFWYADRQMWGGHKGDCRVATSHSTEWTMPRTRQSIPVIQLLVKPESTQVNMRMQTQQISSFFRGLKWSAS